MKFLILSITILLSSVGFSQTSNQKKAYEKETESIVFKTARNNETYTVTISTANYSPNNIGALKDELLGYREKITSVFYNETDQTFTIIYDSKMEPEILSKIYDKHKVAYIENLNLNLPE